MKRMIPLMMKTRMAWLFIAVSTVLIGCGSGTPSRGGSLESPGNGSGPTNTPTPGPLTVTGPVTLTSGRYSYTSVIITNGGALYVNGAVTLDVSGYFSMDSGSTVTGDSKGFSAALGPGAGGVTVGGGGGHGGAGGADGLGDAGGVANDSLISPVQEGSGGGNGNPGTTGGSGGGLLYINVPAGAATLGGLISMAGADAVGGNDAIQAGGGAGGTLFVKAGSIMGNGTCRAIGGKGGNTTGPYGGGGGGGGIIVLSTHASNSFTGTTVTDGGMGGTGLSANGQPGAAGHFSSTVF